MIMFDSKHLLTMSSKSDAKIAESFDWCHENTRQKNQINSGWNVIEMQWLNEI